MSAAQLQPGAIVVGDDGGTSLAGVDFLPDVDDLSHPGAAAVLLDDDLHVAVQFSQPGQRERRARSWRDVGIGDHAGVTGRPAR